MLYDMNFTQPRTQQHSCSLCGLAAMEYAGRQCRPRPGAFVRRIRVPMPLRSARAARLESGRSRIVLLPPAPCPLRPMLRDLDRLMRERAIDAVVVPMHEAMHSSFRWLSRGAKVTRGYAVKVVDRAPVLVT